MIQIDKSIVSCRSYFHYLCCKMGDANNMALYCCECADICRMPWPLCDMHAVWKADLFISVAHFGQCCSYGKVKLPALKQTPHVVADCLAKRRSQYGHLLKHTLSYSAAFQVASSCMHRENIQLSQKLCGATFSLPVSCLYVKLFHSCITWFVGPRC